jgi:hypothetical protein
MTSARPRDAQHDKGDKAQGENDEHHGYDRPNDAPRRTERKEQPRPHRGTHHHRAQEDRMENARSRRCRGQTP